MSKSRNFSIYLLKNGFSASNSLKDGHGLIANAAQNLPANASLYILDTGSRHPWWKAYFGITINLKQESKGALIFLPVERRCFALSFGSVYHHLKDDCYEYDFGLRVTLNCVDQTKLKSTDTLEPGPARRQRTQLPVAQGLTYFDVDKDTNIIKSLTGKVKPEYLSLFKNATGSVSLRVALKVTSAELPGICAKLLERYNSEDFKIAFPDINNIEPVKDPSIIAQLHTKLLEAIQNKDQALQFSVPDIVDYHSSIWFAFSPARNATAFEDAYIGHYYAHLEGRGIALNQITITSLKSDRLFIREGDDGNIKDEPTVYKCLVFDTILQAAQGQTYHLCDGEWYKIDNNFIAKMDGFLAGEQYNFSHNFPDFNHKDDNGNYSEGVFNTAVATGNNALICLDRKDISPAGETQVEPCDLYEVKNGMAIFYHVKRSTLSAHLSHLFNQGSNAIQLLKLEKNSREKLKELIGQTRGAGYLQPIDTFKYRVVYVIITSKSSEGRAQNLPLFSRISLMRNLKAMQVMSVDAAYCFVKDASHST